ncbi:MAG TPA: c-type cytochrome domain-containing protein [Chitinophaga sp.]|uniref:c-type cytochrome domain-containing protein n=1 Tax=Chitinophaga sp. TaxID=1869181 RepID=UPI002BCC09A0|nr:c-type cytochrome domain-containing protein [Chitinophaga sp.]HVI46441.1 c-type cytochrome domain-containing protein [Chitinophaga sp.]
MELTADTGSWSGWIGRSHPLIVHLPIGILFIAFILMILTRGDRRPGLKAALNPVLLAAALSAVASCIAGYLLSLGGGYDERVLTTHQWLGIGVAVISLVLYVVERRNPAATWRLPLFIIMLLLLTAAGHYGGSLTHGDDYLTQAMPASLRKLTGTATRNDNATTYTNIQDARVYEDLVVPVLSARCYGCHNAQKLKGGLRLESIALIRRGGEHGPVLKDSLPEESELYKRLILPENDEHRMPPKGKPTLTPQELELLYWWIAQGAPAGRKVKELPAPPRVRAVLAGMEPAGVKDHNEFVPAAATAQLNGKAVQALVARGVKVLPVAADNNYTAVSCVNAPGFSDKDMALLLPLKEQLIWLDLSGTQITDEAFNTLAELKQLTRLDIRNTQVKGIQLARLSACAMLRYLNLSGAPVSDTALSSLSKNKKLQQLYLYQTGAKPAVIQQLRHTNPDLKIDTGGYRLTMLASDTTVYHKAAK